jgi:hypothetical protein
MSGTRIPFALVGVLLLVGSATFAGSLQPPSVTGPSVDEALADIGAETQSAVRDGVSTAAREAARNPVTAPANTTVGEVINESASFHDVLRLRSYLAVRDRLERLSGTSMGLNVTAWLPATPTAATLRRAKRRVTIERAGDRGTALRATVENVTLTAGRNGQEIGTRTVSPTVTVPVPTLFVHDRVRAFERRLDADPGNPGLGSRLTARMYALTWVRGYAQFGGAPIDNVVTNRHIGLFTNGAVLSMQRDFFGREDPRGAALLDWATANTALTDIVDGTNHTVAKRLSTTHNDLQGERLPAVLAEQQQSEMPGASPRDTRTVGINETADRAFLVTADGLNRTIRQPYRVEVRLRTTVSERRTVVLDEPEEPEETGRSGSLVNVSVQNETTVNPREVSQHRTDGSWHPLTTRGRWVNRTQTVRRTWEVPNGTRQTVERRKQARGVDIELSGRHDTGDTPMRPFVSLHQRDGPLDGPNLVDVERKAKKRLIERRGGTTEIAHRTVKSGGQRVETEVLGNRPVHLSEWVYRDIAGLRERVRNISVSVSKGSLATMQVNPANRLIAELDERWSEMHAVPSEYDGVASRARIAARTAFLKRVRTRLQERAAGHERRRSKLDNKLAETDIGSLQGLQSDYDNRKQKPVRSDRSDITMQINAAPPYLTLGEVDGDGISGVPAGTSEHPLVAHNRNLFTVPYGDGADAVVDGVLGEDRTRLQTAARVLSAAVGLGADKSETAALREEVAQSNAVLQTLLAGSLGAVPNRTFGERLAVVQAALERWEGPVATTDALSNGSAVAAIRTKATERWELSYRTSDRLGLVLEQRLENLRTAKTVRTPEETVAEHAKTVQRLAVSRLTGAIENETKERLKQEIERRIGRSLSRLPAGLPLAPLPPYWYLTVNYWEIQAAGEYARFAVSVPRGSADHPGGRFSYVRDGSAVELDVDGDGSVETLGRATRLDFDVQTSVAIAVPPRPRGVGDVDGQMNEASPGWPTPGD